MNREELKKLIEQIKKYNLTNAFDNTEEFDEWLLKLNEKRIRNFNNLSVEPSSIFFPRKLLINENLLNCEDYNNRVEAMLKLTNLKDCLHNFKNLCDLNFLNSKNYYQDIETMSKADSARYALWIINDVNFIKSKYHNEDLKLISSIKIDSKEEGSINRYVAEELALVAKNKDSIKSPYHQEDMKTIANYKNNSTTNLYDLSCLATNKVSLKDKYHLDNMQMLTIKPITSKYLYGLMTNPDVVNGKNYSEEVKALFNAKSKTTALAIYQYILNPKYDLGSFFSDELYDCNLDHKDISILCRMQEENTKGNLNPKYLEYLNLLNQVDDDYVMFIESILANKNLLKTKYQDYVLKLLLSTKDKDLFIDLFKLATDKNSLNGPYYIKDLELVRKTENKKTRNLLISKAINEYSIKSNNHEYDMNYISKLNWDNIDNEFYAEIYYYLFSPAGIDHKEHVKRLEKLYNGELIKSDDTILEYLNDIEKNVNVEKKDSKVKILSKFKKILKK